MEHEENEYPDEQSNFPISAATIAGLYGLSSVVALFMTFDPSMSAIQSTNCLLISWAFAMGALGITIFSDESKQSEASSDDY